MNHAPADAHALHLVAAVPAIEPCHVTAALRGPGRHQREHEFTRPRGRLERARHVLAVQVMGFSGRGTTP